jgi:long-chain acyl-CoA synthetase
VHHLFLPLVEAKRVEIPTLQSIIVVGADQHQPDAGVYAFSRLVRVHQPIPPSSEERAWENMAALPYSSGTTGLPRGAMLTHKNLVCNAYQSIATARITCEDRMLVFLPLYHIYGIMLLGCAALTGACLVLMERFEPERSLQLIQEQRITLLYSVPQVLSTLSDWPQLHQYDLHTVRFVQCGAAPVPPALARRFLERTHTHA